MLTQFLLGQATIHLALLHKPLQLTSKTQAQKILQQTVIGLVPRFQPCTLGRNCFKLVISSLAIKLVIILSEQSAESQSNFEEESKCTFA